MPKKTVKKTKEKMVDVAGGTVSVTRGIKLSSNYQSGNFEITANLPIKPGETPEDAIERTDKVVASCFREDCPGAMDEMYAMIEGQKAKLKKG